MLDYFSLQCILIHNEFISAQTLININVTDDVFINSFFMHKHQFLTNSIHTSLDLKAFNGQDAGHITHTVTLSMFIPEGFTQHTLFLVINLPK